MIETQSREERALRLMAQFGTDMYKDTRLAMRPQFWDIVLQFDALVGECVAEREHPVAETVPRAEYDRVIALVRKMQDHRGDIGAMSGYVREVLDHSHNR